MSVQGLHHITLITADAQRNVDFYVKVLGLRLLKITVNFDDPSAYHLYYGDRTGTPGSAVTFFEWQRMPRGRPGIGGTHHFALTVDDEDGLLKWKRRLTDLGISVKGPYDRHYFKSIYFDDPDGVHLEIATRGPGFGTEGADAIRFQPPEELVVANRDEERIEATTWPEPVPDITPDMALMHGMHHISAIASNIERTNEFFGNLLGLKLIRMTSNFDDPTSAHWYWGDENGSPGSLLTYFEHDPAQRRYHYAQMGSGMTHHFALSVPDEETQLEFRQKLLDAGHNVSPVMERVYFKSIYTRDPDGHIVELATAGPGFMVDEPDDSRVGQELRLPPWLEAYRSQIADSLTPITPPVWPLAEEAR